jgi:predicted flap endonuclease-1-like 5' DNA nuclease
MQADFLMGVSLLKREDESLYEYWLSFSPMAPFFGVPWRFSPTVAFDAEAPAPEAAPAPAPAKVKAKAEAKAAAPALELVAEAPAPKPAPAAEPAPETSPEPEAQAAEAPEAEDEGTQAVEPAVLYDPAPANPDDLKAIKGVGPKLEAELNALGLYTYAQIAALTPENLVWIDDRLTSFKGRSVRDDWVGQAEALSKG